MKKTFLFSILFLAFTGVALAQNPVVTVKHGGTGASTAAAARTNLGVSAAAVIDSTSLLSGALTYTSEQTQWFLMGADSGSYTIAKPTAGTNDGWSVDIQATTAKPFTIFCTDGFNAKGSTGSLLLGGHIGDGVELRLFNGHFYVKGGTNVTVN